MSHIQSISIAHSGTTYSVRISGEPHNGSAMASWSRDGVPTDARYVPQTLRDSINDLVRDFALTNWYR